jgi:hypothetical protein
MVEKLEDYKWSSFNMYTSEKKEKLIQSSKILNYFNVDDKRNEYKRFVEKAIKYPGKS